MGNRYRCAGTTSETYINGVITNDKVDIKALFLPVRCVENSACFAELNNIIYIANMTDYPASESYIYTYDGKEFKRAVTFPLLQIQDICAFNNSIYFCDNLDLFRIDGDTVTAVTTIPENDGNNDYRLFSLGQSMYLLESRFVSAQEYGNTNNIYRFTGSGWSEVVQFSGVIEKPTCILFRNAIHILSDCYYYVQNQQGVWVGVISSIHKSFNGVSISDSILIPEGWWMQRNAAYVFDNKLRVFTRKTDNGNVVEVLDFDGTSWTVINLLNFDGWISIENFIIRYGFQAFTLNGKQYLFNVNGSMMMEITNPIRLSQYFVS